MLVGEGLIPLRYGRMLMLPFAFYRGSAIIQAHSLAQTPHTGLGANSLWRLPLNELRWFCHA